MMPLECVHDHVSDTHKRQGKATQHHLRQFTSKKHVFMDTFIAWQVRLLSPKCRDLEEFLLSREARLAKILRVIMKITSCVNLANIDIGSSVLGICSKGYSRVLVVLRSAMNIVLGCPLTEYLHRLHW